MNAEIRELMNHAEAARALYRMGKITRAEADKLIQPYADAYNKRSKEIAKEFKTKHKAFSIIGYLR